jgi:hypothetical protein
MQALRVILRTSPAVIRAWLPALVDRVLPLDPDPAGWGQPQLSPDAFVTDLTLRPQSGLPVEIADAGGFLIGLEVAYGAPDGRLQPMGPVVAFLVVPRDPERTEVRIFFPLGITNASHRRVVAELEAAWPGARIRGDELPSWAFSDFDRRALFAAVATGGPLPPGAPLPRRRGDPPPWRDAAVREGRPSAAPPDAVAFALPASSEDAPSAAVDDAPTTTDVAGQAAMRTEPSDEIIWRRGRFPNKAVFRRDVGEAVRAVAKHWRPSAAKVAAQITAWADEAKRTGTRPGYHGTSARAIRMALKAFGYRHWDDVVADLREP